MEWARVQIAFDGFARLLDKGCEYLSKRIDSRVLSRTGRIHPMENVVLIVHLILALCLIAVVLLQRSEGGGLGMGGGGGAISTRSAATALHKLTWGFAIAFIATSLTLTIFAAQNASDSSVIDRLGVPAGAGDDGSGLLPPAESLLPPAPLESDPLAPPPVE